MNELPIYTCIFVLKEKYKNYVKKLWLHIEPCSLEQLKLCPPAGCISQARLYVESHWLSAEHLEPISPCDIQSYTLFS